MKTIEGTVGRMLCHSCGACEAICPTEAISFEETTGGFLFPRIDSTRCTTCGRCWDVCPGKGLSVEASESLSPDPFTGVALECFVGRATDSVLYENSQSGGVVTALLCHGLRTGDLGGALVTAMQHGVPPRPQAYLATTESEVIAAQRSKYSPVAVLAALKQARSVTGPLAVVGLPCHVHGLRHLMQADAKLQERLALVIGLVCERTLTSAAIDLLAERAALPQASMVVFKDKRAGGYPGDVRVTDEEGNTVILPRQDRHRIKDCLTPPRCRICFDKLNVLADVTVGDPWGVPEADHRHGDSVVLARTPAGVKALEDARAGGSVSLRCLPYDRVIRGQKIDLKRQEWKAYMAAWAAFGLNAPAYGHPGLSVPSGQRSQWTFRTKLRWSLHLDSYPDRQTLIRETARRVRRQRLMRVPLAAVHRGRGVLSSLFGYNDRGSSRHERTGR